MRAYLLYYGVTWVDKGQVLTIGRDAGKVVPTPIWGTLLDTEAGYVLVDTGMNPVHLEDPDATFRGSPLSGKIVPELCRADLADQRVMSCSVRPQDIRYVINTHLHFDHCGGNLFFPQAEFVVQKEHYEWAMSEKSNCPRRDFDLPGTKWRFVEGDCEFLPGVRLVTTPGHVPGHQSVIVDLKNSGPLIIASDAICLKETMADGAPITADNEREYHQSVQKLQKLEEELSGRIFVSHEQAEWDAWKHAPEFYD